MSEKKRVAVYLRYEEEFVDEAASCMLQGKYYKAVADQHENWLLTEIYVDEGSVKNQVEFKRLINNCRAGKIDMIIARSVSRFGRNQVEAIETAQYLIHPKPPAVGVFFEKENLDSLDKDSTIMLSIFLLMGLEDVG